MQHNKHARTQRGKRQHESEQSTDVSVARLHISFNSRGEIAHDGRLCAAGRDRRLSRLKQASDVWRVRKASRNEDFESDAYCGRAEGRYSPGGRPQTPVQSVQGSEVRGAVSFPLFPHCFPNKNEISSPAAGLYVQMASKAPEEPLRAAT
ncbi:unnamed protein product, partial [Iphiclides podalirius]